MDEIISKQRNNPDGFEAGSYKPPAYRAAIIKSLSGIKYQSIRHLHINTGLPIDDLLRVVDHDDAIAYKFIAGVTVYFLTVFTPRNGLYNTGDNSFAEKKNGGFSSDK